MKSIVISIGGSVVLSEDANQSFFNKLKSLLNKISKEYKIYLVVGGGKIARTYINFARNLNFEENILDEIGIDVTRINAKILSNILENTNKNIPATTNEASELKNQIIVMGGTNPGHSTDMVGAELAEKINASKFIIATNVDGVYDKDPNKFQDAKQIKDIHVVELINKYGTDWNAAGKNIVIDGPSLEIINRAKIPTFVLNGKRLDQLEKAITNQQFEGTIIKV